jgi:hypothetical protein
MIINSLASRVSARTLPLFAVLFSAGCVDSDRMRLLSGPGVEISATEIQLYRANQDVVVQNLLALAGYGNVPEPQIADWHPVVDAGIEFVQQRCEAYLDAIFWFNRYKSTVVNEINLLGAGTASALGIAQAAARDIALVALAFGITAQTVEVLGSSILYKMDPAAVKSLVGASQAIYVQTISTIRFTTRPSAMRAIQGYLNLCLPPTLEAQVMAAVNNTTFTAVVPSGPAPTDVIPQLRQNAPPPSKIETVEFAARAPDRVTLEQILLYNPQSQAYDPARLALMRSCWLELAIPVDSVTDFLAKQEFVGSHAAVISCIQQRLSAAGGRVTTPALAPVRPGTNRLPPPIQLPHPSPARNSQIDPALLNALEFNSQANTFQPTRLELMKQCWRDLNIVVPSQSVIAFMEDSRFRPEDHRVAACIEQHAPQSGANQLDAGLLKALKFNSQSDTFDPTRVDLMRQCWSDLKLAVPSQSVTTFITDQQFRSQDQPVATCIEKKAEPEGK